MKSKNVYCLPLRSKEVGSVGTSSPAHNGKFKHSIDYTVPEGTPVYAALDGVVSFVEQNSKVSGLDKKFENEGNGVRIKHRNNESSEYWHLRYHGVKVKLKQKVKQGQLIGYSGNTGWTHKPHLHFSVFNTKTEETLKTNLEDKTIGLIKKEIKKADWIFAKTFAKTAPHEYIIKEKNPWLFNAIANLIDNKGYSHEFTLSGHTETNKYFEIDGYRYWHYDVVLNGADKKTKWKM